MDLFQGRRPDDPAQRDDANSRIARPRRQFRIVLRRDEIRLERHLHARTDSRSPTPYRRSHVPTVFGLTRAWGARQRRFVSARGIPAYPSIRARAIAFATTPGGGCPSWPVPTGWSQGSGPAMFRARFQGMAMPAYLQG